MVGERVEADAGSAEEQQMPELDVITERADPRVQRIIDVARSARPRPRTVLIEELDTLEVAIEAGVQLLAVHALDTVELPAGLVRACGERDIPLSLVQGSVLNQIFKAERKAKVFGIARVPPPRRLDEVEGLRGDVVVLDGVRIVGNIGAIVRTCTALGAAAVVLVDSELESIADRRLIRASRGYVFTLPVVLASREELVRHLGSSEISVLVFEADGDTSIHDVGDVAGRAALVFGSEKRGPSDALAVLARDRGRAVVIGMSPRAESLNVSVSVGIGLSARSRQNLPDPP